MFQVSINSIKNIRVIVRKQNFNQNFNLLVNATRFQEISKFNVFLKNKIEKKYTHILVLIPNY